MTAPGEWVACMVAVVESTLNDLSGQEILSESVWSVLISTAFESALERFSELLEDSGGSPDLYQQVVLDSSVLEKSLMNLNPFASSHIVTLSSHVEKMTAYMHASTLDCDEDLIAWLTDNWLFYPYRQLRRLIGSSSKMQSLLTGLYDAQMSGLLGI